LANEVKNIEALDENAGKAEQVQKDFQTKVEEAKAELAQLEKLMDVHAIKKAKMKVIEANNYFSNAQKKALDAAKVSKGAQQDYRIRYVNWNVPENPQIIPEWSSVT